MPSTKISQWNEKAGKVLQPVRIRIQVALVIGLVIIYVIYFQQIYDRLGAVAAALISIPVAAIGWFFGIRAGLFTSFLSIILINFLLSRFGGKGWFSWIVIDWPGDLMVILIGYISGRLHREIANRDDTINELRSRERYLSLINLTIRDILKPRELADRYYFLVVHLGNIFISDSVHFIRWDPEREQAFLTSSTIPSELPFTDMPLKPDESNLVATVIESGDVLAIEDVPDSPYIINPGPFRTQFLATQSALALPLVAREIKLGVVIIGFNKRRSFSPFEIDQAKLAGAQISLVLWTIQQEDQIQKQLKEAQTLTAIERSLSEMERGGIETILQMIVDSARELIPSAERAVLHVLDNENQILMPRAVAGHHEKGISALTMKAGEGVAGQVVVSGEVIYVSDTLTDPRFLNMAEPASFRSLIVAPIQGSDHFIGTISVNSNQSQAFTSGEIRLLGALGVEAALAFENARLMQTTQQDLAEINALFHISKSLVASLDPDQLMKNVSDLLQKDFGYYHVQIYSLEPQSGCLVARQGSGKIGDTLRANGHSLPAGAGIAGHTLATGEPFVTNNVDKVIFFSPNPLLPDTQSILTVPIKIDGRAIGVLVIEQVPPNRLSSSDLRLMTTVAEQLAIALQKANLYNDLQNSLLQEKAMRVQLLQSERLAVVGRLLASVSHELNNPLQAIQNVLFLLKKNEIGLSDRGQRDLDIILSETERMAILLERLRDTYRSSREEDFQDIQLNTIIEDIQILTSTHMRHHDVTCESHLDPELPVVQGISSQFRQVILNLFVNAVEAMPGGGRLTISTQHIPDQNRVQFTVSDTGLGINPEILPHIFEPFITDKETGTGLGLAIVSDIVIRHNGEVQAENNPHGGATIRAWLPVKKAQI
jgi:signal transduction histidine kinase